MVAKRRKQRRGSIERGGIMADPLVIGNKEDPKENVLLVPMNTSNRESKSSLKVLSDLSHPLQHI
jgi:hypothetical protein